MTGRPSWFERPSDRRRAPAPRGERPLLVPPQLHRPFPVVPEGAAASPGRVAGAGQPELLHGRHPFALEHQPGRGPDLEVAEFPEEVAADRSPAGFRQVTLDDPDRPEDV